MRATAAEIVSVRQHRGGKKNQKNQMSDLEASVGGKKPLRREAGCVKPCHFDGNRCRLFDYIALLLLWFFFFLSLQVKLIAAKSVF